MTSKNNSNRKKSTVNLEESNPFVLAKTKSKRKHEEKADVPLFWNCFVCSRRIKNDEFIINYHINHCLEGSKQSRQERQLESDLIGKDIIMSCAIFPPTIRIEHKDGLIKGLWLIYDFISSEEEEDLMKSIDNDSATTWKKSSFNGFTDTKVYGVRTQFGPPQEDRLVRKNDISREEFDIPQYLHPIIQNFKLLVQRFPELTSLLRTFCVNECNINSYIRDRGHYLTPHFDDRALSGPILMNVSLGCAAVMTYSCDEGGEIKSSIPINLPPRCLQIVSEDARYKYKHSIKAGDVLGERRVSLTFREAGGKSGVVNNLNQKGIFGAKLNIVPHRY